MGQDRLARQSGLVRYVQGCRARDSVPGASAKPAGPRWEDEEQCGTAGETQPESTVTAAVEVENNASDTQPFQFRLAA